MLLLSGCGFDFGNPAKLSMDYQIDRPRLVALSVTPPVLQPGTNASFEALYIDSQGAEPRTIHWETCGLRDDVWVINYGLDCFAQSDLVTELGDGNPIDWSPPPSEADCDTEYCGHYVPLLVTADVGGEAIHASTMIEVYGSEFWDAQQLAQPTLHESGVQLRAETNADGRVSLVASVDARFGQLSWRWYVDGGVLYKTGRTATQGETTAVFGNMGSEREANPRRWTDNLWELPPEPGEYRVYVVVSGQFESNHSDILSESENDEWDEDDRNGWIYGENPDQAWTMIEVVQ